MLEKRDGLARICKLELDSKIETPTMLDVEDLKSLKIDFGKAPYILKDIDPERFEILKSKEERLVVATGLKVLSPRRLVELLLELRESTHKPIYTPALATPKNLPLLIYLGVDIVDNVLPIMKAYEGIYMLENCEFELESLKTLPCNCEVCRSNEELDEELLAIHNTNVLRRQLEIVKEQIRRENLRNFVEAHVKFDPELTAMLRIADEYYRTFERYFPVFKRSKLLPTSEDSFDRPEVKTFLSRAVKAYRPKGRVLLILPCSARKPYTLSKSHTRIRSFLSEKLKGVEEIIVSSPLVVPRVFELTYPAMNYDVPVTGRWSESEVEFVAGWLRRFVEKGDFELIVAHVEGGYRRVVERAGLDVIFTETLEELARVLDFDKEEFDLRKSIFEHMVRYQFDVEYYEEVEVKGKYPNLEFLSGERVARVDMGYGMLDIYAPLAKFLIESGAYTVRIGDFDPKGTIFAVGVEDADERIRPNDIVVFYNDSIFGVGRAIMTGWEMVELDRGKALEVKRKFFKSQDRAGGGWKRG